VLVPGKLGPPLHLRGSGPQRRAGCDGPARRISALRILLGTLLCLFTGVFVIPDMSHSRLTSIGPEGRDASTWYCTLLSSGNIPIATMIWLEGQSFHRFGGLGLLWRCWHQCDCVCDRRAGLSHSRLRPLARAHGVGMSLKSIHCTGPNE
jgi:hypothetical protein